MTPTSVMRAFRRRLASFALALTALQITLLFAAPVSACCDRSGAATAHAVTADPADCCPAGSHAPGQCPLHKNKAGQGSSGQLTARSGDCHMLCDAPHGPQFILGAIGIVPAPAVSDVTLVSSAFHSRVTIDAALSVAFPDAPPPKLL